MPRIKKSEVKTLSGTSNKLEAKKPDNKITVKRLHRVPPLGENIAIGLRETQQEKASAPIEEVKDELHTLEIKTLKDSAEDNISKIAELSPNVEEATKNLRKSIEEYEEDKIVENPEIEEVEIESDTPTEAEIYDLDKESENVIRITHIDKDVDEPKVNDPWYIVLGYRVMMVGMLLLGLVIGFAIIFFFVGLLIQAFIFMQSSIQTVIGM